MSMIRSTNPLLTDRAFEGQNVWGNFAGQMARESSTVMTLQGAVNKSAILLAICAATGIGTWIGVQSNPGLMMPALFGGLILGLILTLVVAFKPAASPYVGWLVAVCQGVFAGCASLVWTAYAQKSGIGEALGPGLVIQAVILTFGISGSLLIAYTTRLIRATENFKLGVFAATCGLGILCLASWILGMFGIQIPYIWGNGWIGIGFAAVIVVIAALNLVLDFDFIEQGAENQLPKHMEWYAAIGLLVTLVWLYVSILRLLAKLQSRD